MGSLIAGDVTSSISDGGGSGELLYTGCARFSARSSEGMAASSRVHFLRP